MKNLRNLKHIFAIILITISLLSLIIIFFAGNFIGATNSFFLYRSGSGTWQDKVYRYDDLRPSENIALLLIDEKTLNTLQGRGNLNTLNIAKSDYIRVIEKLEEFGVKGIGFDIVFQNKDPDEGEFAKVLKKYANITIAMSRPMVSSSSVAPCVKDNDSDTVTCGGVPRSIYKDVPWGYIANVEGPENTSAMKRYLRYDLDKDGEKDEQIKAMKISGQTVTPDDLFVYTLPIAMLKDSGILSVKKFMGLYHPNDIVLTPFFGSPDIASDEDYTRLSFSTFLDHPEEFREKVSGKYIFIGESGEILHDEITSPRTGKMIPGVQTHAYFLDGLLQNKMLFPIGGSESMILFLSVVIIMTSVYFFIPKFLSPIIAIIAFLATLWIGRYFYDKVRIVVDIFPLFLSTSLLTYPITYIYKFFVVDREKRLILSSFSRYLSPEVVKHIDTNLIEASLGGEKKYLTILFSDIEGFTTISESMETRDLFFLMTAYLSRMTDILTENQGTLDKYIGDAVMGFYGAPVENPNHAYYACKTAILMRRALPIINQDITDHGIPPIEFRVGIATGEVMVGNIGSESRLNYTVLGDTVNLASRLEATGKEYGVHAIIAADTRKEIEDRFHVRELDYIAVKGKNEGVRIFELIELKEADIDMTVQTTYEAALKLYRDGYYLDAGKIWEKYMEIDPPSRVMALRCLSLLQGETHLDNGIYRMTHK